MRVAGYKRGGDGDLQGCEWCIRGRQKLLSFHLEFCQNGLKTVGKAQGYWKGTSFSCSTLFLKRETNQNQLEAYFNGMGQLGPRRPDFQRTAGQETNRRTYQ